MLAALIIGFCFGFFGSIPIAGPIAALVLKRGLTGRFASAALIGVGGAIAEAGYAFLAFWGFATYLTQYPVIEPICRTLAGIILVGLGISFARYRASQTGTLPTSTDSAAKSFFLGFTITALNPTLIATWTAATTTLYSSDLISLRPIDAVPFSLGALIGIIAWFSLLTVLLKRYGSRFNADRLTMLVRIIGVMLIGLGVWFGVKAGIYFYSRSNDAAAPTSGALSMSPPLC